MKLFHKTVRIYLTLSFSIFIVSIPLFYFLVQRLWIDDVDESLLFQKEKIIAGIRSSHPDSTVINRFTKAAKGYDLGISITPLNKVVPEKDSIYYLSFYDPTRVHVEPFRELKSIVSVNNKLYQIKIRKDLVENADLIRGIAVTQAILFFLLLAGLIIMNNYFAKKTWKPFYQLVSRLNTFRIDKEQPIKTAESEIDEFNDLNHSVSKLTETNIRVFKAQKEFTENAAHETQTPLAAIKNQIDLLAQDKRLTSEQAKNIERRDKNVRRLSQLNRNLLLLAKIDNDQFTVEEDVQIHHVLTEVLSVFDEEIALSNIRLNTQIKAEPVTISNAYLLQLLFSNLVKNAMKYNIPGGFIDIELNNDFFRISNSGKNEPLSKENIFRRFYRKGESDSSSGLGLAIAKRICELLKFDLKYHFEDANCHFFTVYFRWD